jgi:protein CpxP
MTYRRVSVFAVTVAAAALVATGAVLAQGQPQGPPGQAFGLRAGMAPGLMGQMGMLRGLDLTQQQRDELRALGEQRRTVDKPVMDKLRVAGQALEAELLADAPNQGRIDQLKTDLAQAQQEALDARIAMQLKVNQILTPEQRQTLRDRQARRAEAPGRRRGPRGGGLVPSGGGR